MGAYSSYVHPAESLGNFLNSIAKAKAICYFGEEGKPVYQESHSCSKILCPILTFFSFMILLHILHIRN